VVVDADDSPKEAFDLACLALRYAEYPVPDSAFSLKVENGFRTAIYLIPGVNESGTLEHLLLRSAFDKAPTAQACVDTLLECIGKTPIDKPNAVAKMKMSAFVAASFPKNPWATPGPLLQSSDNDLIPLDSIHFKHLGDFLAKFCEE
jgi:hypothetical protein